MPRLPLRRRAHVAVPVALAVALTAASAALAAPAAAYPPNGDQQGSSARTEHQRIVDYWTDERRASAIPRDVSPNPAARPAGKGGGGGGDGTVDTTSTVVGATWPGDGYAEKVTGKVFFTLGSSRYVCSASAVDATTNVVLTAGHCVHDGGAGKTFVKDWIFYPAYDSRFTIEESLQTWTATSLYTTELWAGARDFDDDAGFAVVTNGFGGSLTQLAPLPDIDFTLDADDAASSFTSLGYPAAQKYKGSTLTYCRGPVSAERDNNETLSMACNMTGGSSGGPWFRAYGGTAPTIQSLNSYGYSSLSGYMFGPVFGAPERSAYEAAVAGCAEASATCTTSVA